MLFSDETARASGASRIAMKPPALLLAAAALLGQSYYPRHHISFGAGGASPRAALRGYLQTRPAVTLSYGYRFLRNFQADVGLDTVFGAAGIRDFFQSPFGPLRIRDYQFLIPVGGRAVLPLADDRLLAFGGAGGAYLRYSELIRQPSDYLRLDCPVCASRSGWAHYALAGTAVFLDRGRHFRAGVTVKMYRGHTQGDPLGAIPGVRTRDQWLKIYGELGVSF